MTSQLNASLLRLKLLDALRSGDNSKVDSLIRELSNTKVTIQTTDLINLKETILHYAVQVAPLSTIQHLIDQSEAYNLDINSQDADGNTPLHLAAATSRQEVVKYLLSLPNINDTIVNLKKKQPVELCKDLNLAQVMQFERASFVEKLASDLRKYFSNRDFENLENLLVSNPRASELLDINGSDPDTGNTVLHEFIRKDDLQMCDWILKHGGDPFKRDKRGRLPIDLIPNKSDPLRKLLKSASKDQSIMDPVINTNNAIKTGGAPTYKGYLRKWTNFASGYKLRYFVLDQFGVLSYYTNQDDTDNACRGSLNLGFATLHLDSSEKLKFEIIGKNGIRWHLKANHPIETNRWVWTLQNAITIAKDNIKRQKAPANARTSVDSAHTNNESIATSPVSPVVDRFDPPSKSGSRLSLDEPHSESKRHRLLHLPRRKHKKTGSQYSISEFSEAEDNEQASISRSSTFSKKSNKPAPGDSSVNLARFHAEDPSLLPPPTKGEDQSLAYTGSDDFDYDLDDYDTDNDSTYQKENSSEDLQNTGIEDQIATTKRALDVEVTSLLDLFTLASKSEDQKSSDVFEVGIKTLKSIQTLNLKHNTLIQSKEQRFIRRFERQTEVNKLWEQSIKQLESEITKREETLAKYEGKKKLMKKYLTNSGAMSGGATSPGGTRFPLYHALSKESVPTASGTLPENPEVEGTDKPELVNHKLSTSEDAEQVLQEIFQGDSDDEFFDADEFEESGDETQHEDKGLGVAGAVGAGIAGIGAAVGLGAKKGEPKLPELKEEPEEPKEEKPKEVEPKEEKPKEVESKKEELKEEEPKETPSKAAEAQQEAPATEEKAPPSYNQSNSQNKSDIQAVSKEQEEMFRKINEEGSFLGYENPPRTKLSMDEDNRPKVGLWGILKSMIGKDMTRMTLPVSFNECTSLLQRLAEDIEYSSLLDTAAGYDDSTLRMAYVAAFAASEYASTINRIAKPFNPLLGETFEYCRPDKHYRLICEQVSHHPPISACNAESIKWDYYGENAVASQFKGRSFDFKHLGKMFCLIRPDNGVINTKGERVQSETYSWKKVNTSVVGIIMGNPTVDNYGKMEVTNHTTGDVIVVDLKQRGWKASSAYQLSGHVVDRHGKTHWAIGGHWNSKIYAKKVVEQDIDYSKRRDSLLDYNESNQTKATNDPYSGSKFLIWQAAARPKVPFNLTAFAVTLNGVDDKLKPWLAPSDTRLRPDQRAMEDGLYDEASDEKHRVEEKQRAARKERETKNITYEPNWFVKKKHPLTGDAYWEYNGDYWTNRRDKKLADSADIF